MTLMSSRVPAATNFLVRRVSSTLGLRFPEGWLWAMMRHVAPMLSAFLNTTRGSAMVWVVPPVLTRSILRMVLAVSRYMTRKCSWLKSSM